MCDIQCPYCGNEAIDPHDHSNIVPWGDGDSEEVECGSCGKTLTVVAVVTKVEWKCVDEDWEDLEFEG